MPTLPSSIHPARRLLPLLLAALLTGCLRTAVMPVIPTASIWSPPSASPTADATPTLSYLLPTLRPQDLPPSVPTPDPAHFLPTQAAGPQTYVVVNGDMLSLIAERYEVSLEALVQANGLGDADTLEVGQVLTIPEAERRPAGPGFKLIPDSELVNGPNARLEVTTFVQARGGYLAGYTQEVDGRVWSGAELIERVAADYSVNPRLLLALLEYRTGWITHPDPGAAPPDLPFGTIDTWYVGLYRQLAWAATMLNDGYYRWRYEAVPGWLLADGSYVPADPGLNAGTAGVQHFFARLDDYETWLRDVSPGGFFDTYYLLFGYPFDYAVEPLVPAALIQPALDLPFAAGEVWSFTGGPHSSWDYGSPYGALDFAPPGEALGCVPAEVWVRAVAPGLVVRTGTGVAILDLDLDGLEQTGWVIVYMHIQGEGRVQAGTRLEGGDPIGHPSCEGGISTGTHVHIARRFNGEWLPAAGPVPFVMSDWLPAGTGEEYVGSLSRGGVIVEAFEGNGSLNKIQP